MRRGFTPIETLVVITVIGILAALTLTAVVSSREASRKASCSNNLRQLGVAIANYVTSVGSLPNRTNGNEGSSSLAMMLPRLEQDAAFNSINFGRKWRAPENSTITYITINIFICPSDIGAFYAGRTN